MSLSEIQMKEYPLLNGSFQAAPNVLFRLVEDEAVLLYVPAGTYYGLNPTGILLWEAIQNNSPFLSVVDAILAEYEVEREQVLADLQTLIQNLLNNGLIIQTDV
jgi:Coenzyme PQQ synthesis protein D (PqqD)